jgi:hypothetical protein
VMPVRRSAGATESLVSVAPWPMLSGPLVTNYFWTTV